jgi:GcrA cell cycle regulator
MMLRPEGWTEERVERLKELYKDPSRSLTEIAAELGGGLSRNAVVGKVHRLGLPLRGGGRRVGDRKATPVGSIAFKVIRAIKAKRNGTDAPDVPLPEIKEAQAEARHVGLLDLKPGECRWPYGSGPFTFCGCAVAAPSLPYCLAHTAQSMKAAA